MPIPTTLGLVTAMSWCVKQGWIEGPGGIGDGLPGGLVVPLLKYGVDVHYASFVFLACVVFFSSLEVDELKL